MMKSSATVQKLGVKYFSVQSSPRVRSPTSPVVPWASSLLPTMAVTPTLVATSQGTNSAATFLSYKQNTLSNLEV